MHDPKNFTGPSPLHRPAAQPLRQFGPPPAYVPRPAPVPPPLPDARLTVRPKAGPTPGRGAQDRVGITKALLLALPHLRPGAPIDVVPPVQRGGKWHLDTRPTAARRLPKDCSLGARFTVPALSRGHYLIPAVGTEPGTFGGLHGTAGYREALTFALGPEVMEEVCVTFHGQRVCEPRGTGYYELLPLW